ncbi:hypothetical protein FOA52_015109 [Chlamydomonas sp. UWO 241]|nr:hypothetical protein FOA52_015109 [Chlamydomonas sp. UWO 241]
MPLLVLNEGGSLYEWGDIGSSLVRLTTIHACLHDLTGEHSNAPTTPAAALRQLPALASLCRSAIAAACAELEAHTWREVQALAAAADEASKDWGGTGQPMLPRCGQLLVLLATAVPRWVALLESPSRLLGPLLRHAPETAPLGRLQVAQRALADAWGYGMSEAADQMALAQEVVQDEGKSGSGHLACGYLRLWRRYECAVRAQRWWTSLGAPVWACRALRSHLESVVAMPGPAPPPELLSPPLVDALQEAAAGSSGDVSGSFSGGDGGATECVLLAAAAAVPTTHPLLASLIQSVAALAGAAHSLAMHSAAGGDHHSHTAHAGADAAADAAAGPRRSPPALRAVATSLLLHLRSLQTLREGVGNDGGNGGGNGAPRAPGLAPQTLILVVELLDGVVGECQRPCVSVCLAAPVGGASSGLSREALLYAHATGSVLFAHLYDTLSAARALLLQEWRDSMPLAGMLPSALATPHLSSLYDSLDNSPRPDRARSSDASSCATRVKLVSFGDAPRSGNSATSGDASHGGSGIGERWSVAALLSSVQSMLRMPRGSRVAPLTPAGSGDSGSIRASTADGGSFARASPSGSAGTPHPRAAASAAAAATASQRLVLQLSWGQAAVLGRARALAADLRERVALLGGTLQGGFLSDASSCYATNEPQLARVWLEEGGGAAGAADGSGDSAGSSDGSAPPGACTPGTALVLDRLLRPLCALLASPHWSSPATAPHVFGLAATCVLAALEEQLQGLRRSAWRALGVDGARAALAARMNRDLGALSGAVDAFDAQQQQQEGVAGVKDPTVEQLRRHMSAMAAAWAAPSSTHDGADAAAA